MYYLITEFNKKNIEFCFILINSKSTVNKYLVCSISDEYRRVV